MASLFFITCPYHVGFTKKIPHLKGFGIPNQPKSFIFFISSSSSKGGIISLQYQT